MQGFTADKLKGLTNVQETAEEKLMREMARRNMESQMKGDRESMAQNLQARGMYGSGAELTSQLNSQQEAASRRALEEMSANKNAQDRAMSALGQYSQLGTAMRGADTQEAGLKDVESRFNAQNLADANKFRAQQQQQNYNNTQGTAVLGANAANAVSGAKDTHVGNKTQVDTALTGLGAGVATGGAQLQTTAIGNQLDTLSRANAEDAANEKTGLVF
jgi:hypothetical protein